MQIEDQILQTVYDTSPDAIIVVDEKARVCAFNKMAERLFYYSAGDVLGQNVKMLMPAYFADQHDGYMERYMRTGERRIIGIGRIVTGQRKDGSTFPMELAIGEAKTVQGRFFTGFVRDLTDLQNYERRIHELQQELIHASRLASLGEITTMVAHEVNQPLSASGTYLDVAKGLLATGAKADLERGLQAIGEAGAQIQRIGDTVRRIREFARKRSHVLAVEDINRVIEEANAIAAVGSKSRNIRTTFELSQIKPMARVDRVQIQQVIVNLVRNAIDAMAGHDRCEIVLQTVFNGSGMIEVGVLDSGPGVTEAAAARLFTPFVTTKTDGIGLGLAISRTIVEAHGGKLWHEKSPLGGAAFKFTLPAQPAGA